VNFAEEPEQQTVIGYKGSPKQLQAQNEPNKWKRFVDFITPWLRRKRELGDEFLEAKVMQERATAIRTLTEAAKNIAETKKIAAETAEMASKLDEKNAKKISEIVVDESLSAADLEQELAEDLAVLEAKMKRARILYDARIVQITDKPVPDPKN
jgi:hypothetical protein